MVGTVKAVEKKVEKTFKKVLTNEKQCDILTKLSQRQQVNRGKNMGQKNFEKI